MADEASDLPGLPAETAHCRLEEVVAYRAGDLPPERAAAFEDHLRRCSACLRLVTDAANVLTQVDDTLRAAGHAAQSSVAQVDLILGSPPAQGRRASGSPGRLDAAPALAALLAAGGGGGRGGGPGGGPPAAHGHAAGTLALASSALIPKGRWCTTVPTRVEGLSKSPRPIFRLGCPRGGGCLRSMGPGEPQGRSCAGQGSSGRRALAAGARAACETAAGHRA